MLRARSERGREAALRRGIVLGVAPRERDVALIRRAGRLAKRLDVDLRVLCVTPDDDPATRARIDALAAATAAVRGSFVAAAGADAALRIAELLADGDVLAVESPRYKRRPFGRRSFAVRALAAGVRDLLVLAPRDDAQPASPWSASEQ